MKCCNWRNAKTCDFSLLILAHTGMCMTQISLNVFCYNDFRRVIKLRNLDSDDRNTYCNTMMTLMGNITTTVIISCTSDIYKQNNICQLTKLEYTELCI